VGGSRCRSRKKDAAQRSFGFDLDRKDIFSNRNNQTNTRTGEKFNKKGDKECAGKHSGVKATSNVQSVKIMPHVGFSSRLFMQVANQGKIFQGSKSEVASY